MTAEKVHFTKEKETMLITLYSRALETSTPDLPGYAKLPWNMRAIVRAMEPFTALRRLNRLLLYRF